jgi:tetratricopeptide (TPR) repeat protein
LLALAGSLFAANAKLDTSTPVGQAFARLYNFDFPGAHAILDREIRTNPQDSLSYSVKAAAYLFAELHRLKILQMDFFEDDDKVVDRHKLTPDPAVRAEFFKMIDTARQRSNTRLSAQPGDRDAMFTLCMAAGLVTDYAALVERRRFGSFALAKQTQAYVHKLQLLKPPVYDAYLAMGTTEYVVGSIPFFFRWFIHIENIEGSKQRGIETLQLVSERGRYYPPFARILLAAIAVREKRLADAQKMLAEALEEYPENPLVRMELQRVNAALRRGAPPKPN